MQETEFRSSSNNRKDDVQKTNCVHSSNSTNFTENEKGAVYDHAKVGYGKKIVVDDITLTIESGQIVTLIGPNGSGKSTMLKSLLGNLKLLGGCVYVNGEELSKKSPAVLAKEVSMVLTKRPNPELMTSRDVVATGRYPYTGHMGILSDEDWKIVDDAMRKTHAEEIAEESFLKISDGQCQRVMLARAIAQDTELMVLDEPTSYLDLKYKLDLVKMIHSLAKEEGKAIFLSLHELDLAKAVSDKIVCVNENKIVKIGTPEEIFQEDFVQKLFGIPEEEFDPVTGNIRLKF